jgi:hypothetical protein
LSWCSKAKIENARVPNLNNNDSNSNTVRKTNHSKAKIKSWENEKVRDFQENVDEEKLHTFEQKLSRWQNEIGVTDQAIIDSLLEDLGNIFTGSAKKTFGTFVQLWSMMKRVIRKLWMKSINLL